MEQDDLIRSEERVRALAEAVELPLEDGQIPGLALAFDAAMAMIRDLSNVADAAGVAVAGPYDAAWPEGGRR